MMYKISFLPSNIVEVVGIDLDNGKPGFGKYRVLLVNPLIPSSWFIGFGVYCKTTFKTLWKNCHSNVTVLKTHFSGGD